MSENSVVRTEEAAKEDLLGEWLKTNRDLITKALREERDRLLAIKHLENAERRKLTGNRWLSEMPLCHAWDKITPPTGYTVMHGGVVNGLIGDRLGEPHIYVKNETNIICITPGQFVEPTRNDLEGGERIHFLQEKATGLIQVSENGLALLAGTLDEVYEMFGLKFTRGLMW